MVLSFLLASAFQDMAVQPPLIQAINKGDLAAAKDALHRGASPNEHEILTSKPNAAEGDRGGKMTQGRSALEIAVDRLSVPFVKLLLAAKADPNVRGEVAWTPLMTACQRHNVEMVKLLLKAGAKPNLMNGYGDTAIIFAANMDDLPSVIALREAGADLRGGSGGGTLICAVQSGAEKTVRYLLKAGVDPNFHPAGFRTPLELSRSQYSGNENIEKMLIKAGGKGRSRAALKIADDRDANEYRQRSDKEQKSKVEQSGALAVLTPEDCAVFEAALVRILDDKNKDDWPSHGDGTNIILRETIFPVNEFVEGQINSELTEKRANDITLDMRKDFMRRNVKELHIQGVRFSDSRVLLIPNDQMKSGGWGSEFKLMEQKNARCWVAVELPGFSPDHETCFLRFRFGPTPHGAAGTMMLRKKDGVWKVVWHDFAFYV